MEAVVVPFRPEYDDWLQARRVLRRKEKMHYFYDFGIPVGMSVGILAALIQPPYGWVPVVIGIVLASGLFAAPFWLRHFKWNRTWRNVEGKAFIQLSEDGVGVLSEFREGNSSSTVRWSAIKAYEEERRVFFFLTKGSMLFIPKRSLRAEQMNAIRSFALKKVGASC